jgi:CubicO group peptidase (beta-lactamase class C family)
MTFSVTKSYLSAVTGLAVDRSLIRSVDDPVLHYVWDGTCDGEHNGKVTWKHLLQQTSDWSGCLFTTCDWSDRPPKEGGIDEWKNRNLVEPGTQFEYNDTRVNLLAYSLLQVWRKPLPAILRDYIMDPVGASTTWRWYGYENSYINLDGLKMQSVSGGGHFGGGLFISTIDHARFGLLYLRNGKWKDQQLISKSWVEQSQKPSAVFPSYGYMWWTNAEQMYPDVPDGIYSANGFGGNYIIIDPEHDLVIVTRWMDNEKIKDVIKLIVGSCR